MNSDNDFRIILVKDAMESADSTAETAFELAKRLQAKVTIIDTVREPSTITRWISSNAGDVFELVIADKQKRLQTIADRFYEAGIDTTAKVLFGKSSEAISREAIESNADLVIRYMKGVRSRFPGLFGNTSRNLMRICPCPVLFVNQGSIENPYVLACINACHGIAENEAILRSAEAIATASDHLRGIYCWEVYAKDLAKSRLSDESFEQMLSASEQFHQKQLSEALTSVRLGQFVDRINIQHGEPQFAIPEYCREHSMDIVVMCSASLNHPIQRFLGSTVESVMENLPCSLLVVKPHGFRSPLKS